MKVCAFWSLRSYATLINTESATHQLLRYDCFLSATLEAKRWLCKHTRTHTPSAGICPLEHTNNSLNYSGWCKSLRRCRVLPAFPWRRRWLMSRESRRSFGAFIFRPAAFSFRLTSAVIYFPPELCF